MAEIETLEVQGITYHVTETFKDSSFPTRRHFFLRRLNGRKLWHVVKYGNGQFSKAQAISTEQHIKFKRKNGK